MTDKHVLVTFSPTPEMREAIDATLGPLAQIAYLGEVAPGGRSDALGSADAVFGWILDRELEGPDEFAQLSSAGLLQLLSAGVDQVRFDRIPASVAVASNAGAYAGPMAEHVLAMTLALAKHLPQRYADMKAGIFDHESLNREMRGAVVCVVGFGGIGKASAQLFSALGCRIRAIARSPIADEWVELAGTLDDLGDMLGAADVVVLSIPLTRRTRGLMGASELSRMKPDAILVNVARGAVVDESALYDHLVAHPEFQVAIDTWWDEPRGDARFSPRLPFLDLPNVLGSPHNSGMTGSSLVIAARDAVANIARALEGAPVEHLVDRGDYLE